MIKEELKKTIARHNMLKSGDKVLVSVSGGPDSVCLLYVLNSMATEKDLTLNIIHFNHNLRKRESDKEEEFMRGVSDKLNIPIIIQQLDVMKHMEENKLGIEEAARNLRYAELTKLVGKLGINKVAMGHTASDQAETVLMRILRGTGPEGLSGIPAVRPLTEDVKIIRPLINIFKYDIVGFLQDNRISFCIDTSNNKPIYFRNKVRLKLLPYLERHFDVDVARKLLNVSDIIREENDYLNKVTDRAMGYIVTHKNKKISIDFRKLLKYNKFLRRRIIYRILEGKTTLKNIDSVIEFAEAAGSGIKLSLPGYVVKKDYRELVFSPPGEKKNKRAFRCKLKFPGKTKLRGMPVEFSASIKRKKPVFGKDKNTVYFDAEEIDTSDLTIRSRREGDRFRPFGGNGSKKLKDFFIDEKVSSDMRDEVPLLVSRNEILWVVGMRQAEDGRVTGSTKKILEVKVNNK